MSIVLTIQFCTAFMHIFISIGSNRFKDVSIASTFGTHRQCFPEGQRADFVHDHENKNNVLLWRKSLGRFASTPSLGWGFLSLCIFKSDTDTLCGKLSMGPFLSLPWSLGVEGKQSKHEVHAACCTTSTESAVWPRPPVSSANPMKLEDYHSLESIPLRSLRVLNTPLESFQIFNGHHPEKRTCIFYNQNQDQINLLS